MQQHRVCMRICSRRRDAPNCDESCRGILAVYAGKAEKVAALLRHAEVEAAAAMRRLNLSFAAQHGLCGRPSLLGDARGEVVNITRGRRWRYYSLLACGAGATTQPRLCLVYKENVAESKIWFMRSSDGLDFGRPVQLFAGTPFARDERLLAHNLALLRVPSAEREGSGGSGGSGGSQPDFVLAGGMGPATLRARPGRQEGIRLSRGATWPWANETWSAPRVVISADAPAGCLDRRPSRLLLDAPVSGAACEFDGRLSLVHHRGALRLFARANLWENARSGGRWVQTTTSADGGSSWARWEPLRIGGVLAGRADVYFFAAQPNPVDESSLLALFPMTQPPHACIGLAFSHDGVRWSTPRSLRRARLAWRTRDHDGFGPIEWRAADHPVASGAAHDGLRSVWFYLHHGVSGMSMERGRRASGHVARYRLPVATLRRLTRLARAELQQAARVARPT